MSCSRDTSREEMNLFDLEIPLCTYLFACLIHVHGFAWPHIHDEHLSHAHKSSCPSKSSPPDVQVVVIMVYSARVLESSRDNLPRI